MYLVVIVLMLYRHSDEQLIVTPFAQILHRLQIVRNSYSQLTNVSGVK